MPLLGELRGFFRRRKQIAVIDLNVSEPGALDAAAATRSAETNDAFDNGQVRSIVDARPMRARSADDLQRSYDDVMSLVRKVNEHLDRQTDCTERLLTLLERLPEINRQNSNLLEMLATHFSQAENRETTLNAALARFNDTATHQTDVLGLLQQQLDHNGQATVRAIDAVASIRPALAQLAESGKRSNDLLTDISRSTENRELRLAATLKRTQFWIIAALVLCGIASLTATTVALMALLNR